MKKVTVETDENTYTVNYFKIEGTSCLYVEAGDSCLYVEAWDENGKLVLAVTWTSDGAGDVTLDEVSDKDSDAIFAAVMQDSAGNGSP